MFKKKYSVAAEPAATRRRYMKPAVITVAVLLVVGSIVGLTAGQKKDEPKKKGDEKITLEFTPSDVATVETRPLVNLIQFSGSLAPVNQTTVKSKVAGDMNRVLVREGETVSQGQLLAQVDTADLQARLDAAAANYEEAKAKLVLAEKNRENNHQLLTQKFISQNAFDTSLSVHDAAAANARSADAQLRLAKKAIEDATIRAPFAGIVARKMINPGEKVAIDSPLLSIVDLGRMEIEAPAPASEIPSVRVGQAVSFRVDGFGDRSFEGRVERINPTADAGSRSITLYISVNNHDGVLKGGMFTKGQIVLEKSTPAFVVPAAAVRDEQGQSYVYTLEGGKIGKRAVKVGTTEGQQGMVEIKSGVENGLTVVSARVTGLKAGDPAVMKAAQDVKPATAAPDNTKAG